MDYTIVPVCGKGQGPKVKRVRLAQRRRIVGLSQEKLAEVLGVDVSTVRRWEYGDREPQPWYRPSLAVALKISLEELAVLLGDGDEEPHEANERVGYVLARPASVDLVTVGYLREKVMRLDERYEGTPSSSLIAHAGELHGQVTFLRSSAKTPQIRRELWAAEAESALLVGQLVWDVSQRRDHAGAIHYFDSAIIAAGEAQVPSIAAYAELRKSYVALYGANDPKLGLALTERAAAASTGSPVIRGLAALHSGEAHAMLGDQMGCDAALGEAEEHFGHQSDDDPATVLFCPTSHGRLAGSCYLRLGQAAKAEATLEALHQQLTQQKKSTAIVHGNLSLASVRQKNVESAAAHLHRAIDVLERTRGAGGLNVVVDAARELCPWRRENVVAEVNDRLLSLMTAA